MTNPFYHPPTLSPILNDNLGSTLVLYNTQLEFRIQPQNYLYKFYIINLFPEAQL